MSDLLDPWRRVADRDLPISFAVESETRVLRPQGVIGAHLVHGDLVWTEVDTGFGRYCGPATSGVRSSERTSSTSSSERIGR